MELMTTSSKEYSLSGCVKILMPRWICMLLRESFNNHCCELHDLQFLKYKFDVSELYFTFKIVERNFKNSV